MDPFALDFQLSDIQSVTWAKSPELRPSRLVMSRSRLCNRFKFPSLANGIPIYLEGVLEFRAAYWLEALVKSGAVIAYREQPGTLSIDIINGSRKRYFPDFLLSTTDRGEWLVEVKPLKIASKPEFRNKHRIVGHAAHRCGLKFAVWTEKLLADDQRLQAIKRGYHRCLPQTQQEFWDLSQFSEDQRDAFFAD